MAKILTGVLFLAVLFSGLESKLFGQSFPISSSSPVANSPQGIAVADINNDGKKDLIVAGGLANILTILKNDGSGIFTSNAAVTLAVTGTFPSGVTAADVNGDGKIDLVCPMSSRNAFNSSFLAVMTNNGDGTFTAAGFFATGTNPVCVAVADVDGNGKMDLISGNAGNFSLSTLSVYTNNGNGSFVSDSLMTIGTGILAKCTSITAADLNGDGFPDVACSFFGLSTLSVYTNNSHGQFILASTPAVGNGSTTMVITADVNHDGKTDLVAVNSGDSTLSILTNKGAGIFVLSSTPQASSSLAVVPYQVVAADVNGDGLVDLACADSGGKTVTVLTNNGTGGFVLAAITPMDTKPYYIAAADLNGDGRLDLVTANPLTNTITIFTNAGKYLPKLALAKTSGQAVIKWPSEWSGWAGWSLQQSPDLTGNHWESYGGDMADDGVNVSATNSSPAGQLFFRLEHP